MKKIGVIVFVVLCLVFYQIGIAIAGVYLYFDYQDGKVSKEYVEFSYEFGSQLLEKVKKRSFQDNYTVKVIEKGMVIAAVVNKENKPLRVKVKDLSSSEKIKKKAKEFSEKVFQRLLQMEKGR